jgi:hypothetical protein
MLNNTRKILLTPINNPWKWLVDFWGYLTIIIFMVDFFLQDYWRVQSTGIAIIYTAILLIYTSNKEFQRWQKNNFLSRFHGEIFIALWTVVMFLFTIMTSILPQNFQMEPIFYTTYITVLGIFAVTLNSKKLKIRHKARKKA